MKKIKLNVYVDMDGVIADFMSEPLAVNRFMHEEGFFRNLKPMNVKAFQQLLKRKDFKVFIISKSPHKRADREKIEWLKEHFPKVKKRRVILIRPLENKSEHMLTKRGILLDDYGKNCKEWEKRRGNMAIQVKKPLQEHFQEFTTDLFKWGY